MSKRDLKNYLSELSEVQLCAHILELYQKFPEVKTYYDFVFNPNEDKLLREAKIKIKNEYFPAKGKRAKMRRTIAQKIIKHFRSLGVDPFVIADVMLYNIEIAQVYSEKYKIGSESFYKSFYTSFSQSVTFLIEKEILDAFKLRLHLITEKVISQNWPNKYGFSSLMERFDY